jgi:predicted ribosome quality control (RQC) complex YloA/Tae2 family protein
MPVDSLSLAALVTEARPLLVGGRLTTLSQAERGVVSLAGRSPSGETWHWRIDLRDGVARAHLSALPVVKGAAPPWLLQMRKHVEGARILGVAQAPWERVIRLRLAGRDSLGDPRTYVLVAEIVGRYSLLCMVDEPTGTIMASSRLVDETMSRLRQVAPGLPYALPPGAGDRRNLDACTDDELDQLARTATVPLSAWVARTIAGLGRDRVAEVVSGLPAEGGAEALAGRLRSWRDAWRQGLWHWAADGEPGAHVGEGPLAGFNAAIDSHYRERLAEESRERLRAQVQHQLDGQRSKVQEQLADLDRRWADCEGADRLQQEAELLQGNLYRIPAGSAQVTLENYFDPACPPLTLDLDPDLSPAENVQARFRRAQKAQRQREHLQRQRQELEARSWDLEEAAAQLAAARAQDALEDLAATVLPRTTDRQSAGHVAESKPERYRSGDGLVILVGRSSRQNEAILHGLSRGHDLWLHAQNIPGAHVLVKVPKGTSVPDRTVEQAACLAAFFSKARHSQHVPVVAVERRFVRQARGAAAGLVHYTNETALWVDPAPETLPCPLNEG